jgi:hypothetical protein
MDEKQKISDLCEQSLKEKWFAGSTKILGDLCPFCKDVYDDCDHCLCPREICNPHWRDAERKHGYVQKLILKYDDQGNVHVCEIAGFRLAHIIKLFKKYIVVKQHDEYE